MGGARDDSPAKEKLLAADAPNTKGEEDSWGGVVVTVVIGDGCEGLGMPRDGELVFKLVGRENEGGGGRWRDTAAEESTLPAVAGGCAELRVARPGEPNVKTPPP